MALFIKSIDEAGIYPAWIIPAFIVILTINGILLFIFLKRIIKAVIIDKLAPKIMSQGNKPMGNDNGDYSAVVLMSTYPFEGF